MKCILIGINLRPFHLSQEQMLFMGILELQAKNRQKKRDRLNITYTSYQFYLLTEGPGFEPGLTDSKSAVLPLNYPSTGVILPWGGGEGNRFKDEG